jgi:hypothetical protein
MPAKSPEAIERKRQRVRQRRAEKRAASIDKNLPNISRTSAEYRRRFPVVLNPSKRELDALLAQAVRNTAGASA